MSDVIWTESGEVSGRGKVGMLGRWGKLGMIMPGRAGERAVSSS